MLGKNHHLQKLKCLRFLKKKFSLTLNNQTIGEEISYACKFAFAGGLAVTPYLKYKVGDKCLPDKTMMV